MNILEKLAEETILITNRKGGQMENVLLTLEIGLEIILSLMILRLMVLTEFKNLVNRFEKEEEIWRQQ